MGEDFPNQKNVFKVYSASPPLIGARVFQARDRYFPNLECLLRYGALFGILVGKDSKTGSVSFCKLEFLFPFFKIFPRSFSSHHSRISGKVSHGVRLLLQTFADYDGLGEIRRWFCNTR